jgi:adhesin transport system outer membrane protein
MSLIAVICSCSLRAQVPKIVTLVELLRAASSGSPALISDSVAVNIQQSRVSQSDYNWLPTASVNYQANVGTNNNLPGGYFSYGIVPSNSRVRNEANASSILTDLGIASFQWEAFNFGANKAERNVVSSGLVTSQARFTQSKYELQALLINQYLQLLQLNRLMHIQELNIQRNLEIRKSIQALAKNGIIAGVDTSIAQAELSKSKLILIELENQYRQVSLELATRSGFNAEMILPDTNLVSKLIAATPQLSQPSPDSINHPLLGVYRSMYEQNKLERILIQKQYLPKVFVSAAVWGRGSSITGNDEFKSMTSGLGFQRGNYLAGVGISYDLFNSKRKRLALNIKEAEIHYADTKIREQDALLKLGFRQADAEVDIARRRFEEIPVQLKAAQAAYRQKLSLYKNGLNDIVELNAAVYILYRAETDFIIAENALCKALFQKAFMENTVARILEVIQ